MVEGNSPHVAERDIRSERKNPNANMIRAAETVWIQPNALSHANYYKIINIVRQNQIPVYYFGYASAQKCALQLAKFDGVEQMWI